ncbi:MAG: aminoacyl--tRNA ligase-related protein [Candidatus Poribacteria bacterium]
MQVIGRGSKPQYDSRDVIAQRVRSQDLVLFPDGEELPLHAMDNVASLLSPSPLLKGVRGVVPALRKLIFAEAADKPAGMQPPSIDAMRRLELVDYEEASDAGNFRFYPKGALIFNLLKDWAEEIAVKRFGAMEIETPLLYDWAQPDIRAQGESFHERHYNVVTPNKNKELVLRFAGDFGLFRMMKDTQFSHRQLPVRVYEFSKSFRYERRGELSGLRRLRSFSMPDLHSFCGDISQGWEEYEELYRNYTDLADATRIEYAIAFRVVGEFYDDFKERILKLLQYSQQPALVEVLSAMKHYWAVKHEFHGIDTVDGTCQLSTVQLDVEDAERYGISYTDQNGQKRGCIICHSSIGSIERWLYCILEEALKSKVPTFPLWLNPTQLRIIPVADRHIAFAQNLADALSLAPMRVDIDDRNETVGKKVRKAEREWVSYYIVVGDRELQSDVLSLKSRSVSRVQSLTVDEIKVIITEEIRNMPFRPLAGHQLLSKRPIFVGE